MSTTATDTLKRRSADANVISGGHLAAQALKNDGVDTIFTLCGGPIIDIYDGDTGIKVASVPQFTMQSGEWKQFGGLLAQYAPGTRQGYAQVRRVLGTNPFILYTVINDGANPGERSGDGAFSFGLP